MIGIPEEKKSRFGIFNVFKRKEEPQPPTEVEKKPIIKGELKEVEAAGAEEEVEEEEEGEEERIEIVDIEEDKKKKVKEKAKEEELKKRYGVIRDIPKRKVEEEYTEIERKPEETEEGEVKFHDLVFKLEKMDGKLEILDRSRDDMNERVTQLAEEIGELRTMIMERERSFDEVRSDFEKVKDIVSSLDPMKLTKHFARIDAEILENKVKNEKIESLVNALKEENKRFRGLMEKIKSFENLIDISYEIDRKVSKVNEVKDYADKVASKVENIFSELNEKLSELENQKKRIEKLDELTIEMTKMLDEISVKLTRFVDEKDLKEFKIGLAQDLKKLLESKAPVVKITGDQFIQNKLSEMSSSISKLKSVVESQNTVLNNIIDHLSGGTTPEPKENYQEI